jgi:hypothetical protein
VIPIVVCNQSGCPDDQTVSPEAVGIGCLMFGTLYGQAIAESDATRLPLVDAEVTWKILVMWRRARAGGALKALLDALFTKVTSKANPMNYVPSAF